MLTGYRLIGGQGSLVHAQDARRVAGDRQVFAQPGAHADGHAELFAALAYEGLLLGLTGLDLAARELPPTGEGCRRGTLTGEYAQHAVVVGEDGRADHD